MFFFFALAVRSLRRVFDGSSSIAALEVENAVLRHQLAVLGRRVKRPALRRRDQVLLAAAGVLLPRCLEHVREDALIIRAQDADRRAWRTPSNHLPTYAL